MILNDFQDLMTYTAEVYRKIESYNEDTQETEYEWALFETVNNVAFFEGSSAERYIAEKFRAEVDGIIIMNPISVTNTIDDSYRIKINGVDYSVIHNDNVLLLGEVYAIAVKRWADDV